MKREAGGRRQEAGQESPASNAQPSTGGLTPGGKPHHRVRRRFKIDLLPGKAQAVVFRGFARGDPYYKIKAALQELGHSIGIATLCRYWGNVWQAEHDRLRQARANLAALIQALQVEPDSPHGKIAEELLYTIVFEKLPQIEKEGPWVLLHEAREQQKLSGRDTRAPQKAGDRNPVEQARESRRRWRELYGLDAQDENEEGEDEEK